MLSLTDTRWQSLLGGRRAPYDASKAIRALELGEDVWKVLWDQLHHQGDVDTAAYAALPHLVRIAANRDRDWNVYALAATIEVERHRINNPPLPDWATESYDAAWEQLLKLALSDLAGTKEPLTIRCAISVVALSRGDAKLGALLSHLDSSDVDELAEEFLDWSQLYR